MTRQRVIVVGTLARGPTTFPVLMIALGIPEDYTRLDYARAHRIVMDLVSEGIIVHHKKARHHASMFELTPAGWVFITYYRREYRDRLATLEALSPQETYVPPLSPSSATPPAQGSKRLELTQPVLPAAIKCSVCGESIPVTRAKELLDKGEKVVCPCSNNLTLTARQVLE